MLKCKPLWIRSGYDWLRGLIVVRLGLRCTGVETVILKPVDRRTLTPPLRRHCAARLPAGGDVHATMTIVMIIIMIVVLMFPL